MPICIECKYPVPVLYTTSHTAYDRNSGSGVRLTQCPRCKRFADKYVEHDFVVLFIDLVLIKPQVTYINLFHRAPLYMILFLPEKLRAWNIWCSILCLKRKKFGYIGWHFHFFFNLRLSRWIGIPASALQQVRWWWERWTWGMSCPKTFYISHHTHTIYCTNGLSHHSILGGKKAQCGRKEDFSKGWMGFQNDEKLTYYNDKL